ncbi:MAG: hypothetical protein AAGB03_03680 [Pseudomonadota bacterium]
MTQNVTEEAGTFYAEAAKNRSDASSCCAPAPDTALLMRMIAQLPAVDP